MKVVQMIRRLWCTSRAWLVGIALLGTVIATNVCFTQRAVPPTTGTDSPTLSAVLVALGGCRGIISEVLWWRIADLQRQNRYAELVPLTDLLVALDPASADTWVYNAWNLSYNISAAHQDADEKWYWVKEGIALLERGLRAAPRATPILRQLGWIFEDKLGGSSDIAAPYYRAHIMELGVPADASAFAATTGVTPNWQDPLVRALYWYWRAEHGRDMLRITLVLVANRDEAAWLPFLIQMARAEWEDLAPRQRDQVVHFFRQLSGPHAAHPAIQAFLEEVSP